MNLYWLVELDAAGTAIRTLAVVGEDGERRCYQLLSADPDLIGESAGSAPVMMVDVDVVVRWAGHRLALVPVATPPLTADLDEAVADLAARVAATMMEAS